MCASVHVLLSMRGLADKRAQQLAQRAQQLGPGKWKLPDGYSHTILAGEDLKVGRAQSKVWELAKDV